MKYKKIIFIFLVTIMQIIGCGKKEEPNTPESAFPVSSAIKTTVSLMPKNPYSSIHDPVVFLAAVQPEYLVELIPLTGTITFRIDGVDACIVPLEANTYSAECSTVFAQFGTHSIQVFFTSANEETYLSGQAQIEYYVGGELTTQTTLLVLKPNLIENLKIGDLVVLVVNVEHVPADSNPIRGSVEFNVKEGENAVASKIPCTGWFEVENASEQKQFSSCIYLIPENARNKFLIFGAKFIPSNQDKGSTASTNANYFFVDNVLPSLKIVLASSSEDKVVYDYSNNFYQYTYCNKNRASEPACKKNEGDIGFTFRVSGYSTENKDVSNYRKTAKLEITNIIALADSDLVKSNENLSRFMPLSCISAETPSLNSLEFTCTGKPISSQVQVNAKLTLDPNNQNSETINSILNLKILPFSKAVDKISDLTYGCGSYGTIYQRQFDCASRYSKASLNVGLNRDPADPSDRKNKWFLIQCPSAENADPTLNKDDQCIWLTPVLSAVSTSVFSKQNERFLISGTRGKSTFQNASSICTETEKPFLLNSHQDTWILPRSCDLLYLTGNHTNDYTKCSLDNEASDICMNRNIGFMAVDVPSFSSMGFWSSTPTPSGESTGIYFDKGYLQYANGLNDERDVRCIANVCDALIGNCDNTQNLSKNQKGLTRKK